MNSCLDSGHDSKQVVWETDNQSSENPNWAKIRLKFSETAADGTFCFLLEDHLEGHLEDHTDTSNKKNEKRSEKLKLKPGMFVAPKHSFKHADSGARDSPVSRLPENTYRQQKIGKIQELPSSEGNDDGQPSSLKVGVAFNDDGPLTKFTHEEIDVSDCSLCACCICMATKTYT
jgi:hypothetical protein